MDTFETLAADLLAQQHSIRFRANGSSMRPFILDGDSVEIQPLRQPNFKRSDIVLYRLASGRLLLHRVVQVCRGSLLIQGDALPAPDGWADGEQVLGKAVALYRNGKRIDLLSAWWVEAGKLWLGLAPLRCRVQPWLQALWRKMRPGHE